jgi:peptidoglycan hydrolase-like protein with peptidoglycan-binding domain
MRDLYAEYCARAAAKTAVSKTLILFDLPRIAATALICVVFGGHFVCLHRSQFEGRMELNIFKFKTARWPESYILATLLVFLFSYGCALFSSLSESEVQVVESPRVPVYEQPTQPVVSDFPKPVKSEDSRVVSWLEKTLTKQEIMQIQARLKATGFDPGPIDGVLGPKTRSVLLRLEAGCTIVNQFVATAGKEILAPAADPQVPELRGSVNTLSKSEIQLLQNRLKAAGFNPGPVDGILGTTTRAALSRCKSGCNALNDLSGTSDKPAFGQTTEIQSPRATASAKPTPLVNNVVRNQKIQLAQERLKAAGFDPGPIDGKLGPQTKSALEKYRASHKLTHSGIEPLLNY